MSEQGEFSKLYILVRDDLKPGLAAAQACHASVDFVLEHTHSHECVTWWLERKTIVILSVSRKALEAWLSNFDENLEAYYSSWREPDMENELTAIAVLPKDPKMF